MTMALGTCVDLIVAKGTKLSIGSHVLGHGSLAYTEVGMIESFGDFGPDASVGSFTPIGTGIAGKYLGTTDNGELALTIAKTTTDSGLTALIAASKINTPLAYQIVLSDTGADTYTFNGLCRSVRVNVGSGDDVVKINCAIALTGVLTETP
jgi:hypothetical protein